MLRIHQSQNVAAIKQYFDAELSRCEYYDRGNEPGVWFGKGAKILGLEGHVQKEDFLALCNNRRPDNGEKLNPRDNDFRRPGYDFTFNCPKSVSVLAIVLKDERVVGGFQQAVTDTLAHIERDIHVRVRKGGVVDTRRTGNVVGSLFTHYEARPVDGLTCANLHCHGYLHNTSLDSIEGKFKAGEFFPIVRDAVYYEAIFHSKLAGKLAKLGYTIENKPFSFEIAGIGEENIRRFSRRSQEVKELAHQLGISGNSKAMSKLAALSRKSKRSEMSSAEKFAEWRSRLDWASINLDQNQRAQPKITAKQAVELAIKHVFERKSVIPVRRIVAEAMQNSLGDCSFEEIVGEIRKTKGLIVKHIEGVSYVTTEEIMSEEKGILSFLKKTKSTQVPMLGWYREPSKSLNREQREAVEMIMRSRDRVTCISGRAGSGKTTLLTTAVAAMRSVGMETAVFAPTSAAAHQVLKDEGFENSDTVQQLLANPELQEQMKGKVLWVDEAGLLSTKEMIQLCKIAYGQKARLILSGDAFQHKSVARGDAFRLICSSEDVTVKEISQIYRQRRADYKKAVTALSLGDAAGGLATLEEMGSIREIEKFEDRLEIEAQEYVESLDQFKTVLAVSPTHLEGRLLTHEIRQQMRERGKLGAAEISIPVYRSRNLTEGQQKLAQFYRQGDVVRFHRKAGSGFDKGDIARVVDKNEIGIFVQKIGERDLHLLDFNVAEKFGVFEESVINVAVGDLVRVTQNTKSLAGKKLFNGNVHQITAIGDIITLDGKHEVRAADGFLDMGYCSTSHSSQGKTADKVIISQSGLSFDAASLEQFYVSVSRGRDAVTIFTDSKAGLLDSVKDPAHRMLATELEAWTADEEEIEESRSGGAGPDQSAEI